MKEMFEIKLIDEEGRLKEYIKLPVTKEFIKIINGWLNSKIDDASCDNGVAE